MNVSSRKPSTLRNASVLLVLSLVALMMLWGIRDARAYALLGIRCPYDTPVVMYLQLGTNTVNLSDGFTSWNQSASDALARWNPLIGSGVQFRLGTALPNPISDGDLKNSIYFSANQFGLAWGDALASTTRRYNSSNIRTEADVAFNSTKNWDSYRGALRTPVYDFHRVAIHEFGHVLGLNHPDQAGQSVTAVMNARVSNVDSIQSDDAAGIRAIYGTPSAAETISTPTAPTGPARGNVGASYTFGTGGAATSAGHAVQYNFDWGDGTTSGYLTQGTTTRSHAWTSAGTFQVKVSARCAVHTTLVSFASAATTITVGSTATSFTATPTAGPHGTITPNAPQSVPAGGNIAFYALSAPGYTPAVWLVNGVPGFPAFLDDSLQISDVRSNFTIQVNFKLAPKPDFYHDKYSDLIWQNRETGQRDIWNMFGTRLDYAEIIARIPTVWEIVGTGHFNNDGTLDILWQNRNTGERDVWLMTAWPDQGTPVRLANIPTAWNIAGTGDFNGDGKDDILWQNRETGARDIWLMNGLNLVQAVRLANIPIAWNIVGTGDFNTDGSPDVLWQNRDTGQRDVWLMNGTVLAEARRVANVPTDWDIVGTGDFNRDDQADIVWQNRNSGQRDVWLMRGTDIERAVNIGNVPVAWEIRNR